MNIGDISVTLNADIGDTLDAFAQFKATMDDAAGSATSLTSTASALANGLTALEGDAKTTTAGFSTLEEEIAALVAGGMSLKEAMDASSILAAGAAATTAAGAFTDLGGAAATLEVDAKDVADTLGKIGSVTEEVGTGMLKLSDGATAVVQAQDEANSKLQEAQGVLSELQAAFDAGQVSEQALARGAEELQTAFAQANPLIKESGEDAGESAAGFKEMAEKLLAFGEALAITEGLKEFGLEALTAADNVTRASIALTTITGSASGAKETIEGLEKLGISDGLSFPSLLTAGTRMQQLLPEGTDVAAVLAKIADGAAVMGTDINAAATKFDVLASSGNASGKSLLSLGLTMDSLTNAINKLNPSLITTTTSAKDVFKALDPGDRIKVLETALNDLGGTAQKVAEQTFGGQWQILANQWDAIMVEVGKALMPVITDLTSFAKTDVLPFLKSLVAEFNELPGPVKDVTVSLALAAAAIAPLAVAVGGFGLAVSAMEAAIPALAGLVEGLGGAFAVLGVSMGEVLIPIGLLAAGIAAIHFSGLDHEAAEFATNLKGNLDGIVDLFNGIRSSIDTFFESLTAGATSALKPFEQDVESAWKSLSDGVGSAINPVASALGSLWESFSNTASQAATEAFKEISDALDQVAQKAKPATDALGHVRDVLTETTPKQEAFVAGVTVADPTLRQLAEALAAVSNALDFLGGHYQTMSDAMTKGNPMMAENAKNMHDLAEQAMQAAGLFDKHTDSIKIHTAAVQADTPEVIKLAQATHDLGDFTIAAIDPMLRQAAAADALATKLASLAGSEQQANANMLAAEQQLKDIQLQYDANAVGVDKLVEAQQRLIKAAADAKAATEAFTVVQIAAAKGFSDFNTAISQASPAYKSADDALQGLHDTLKLIGDDEAAAPAKMTPLNQAMADFGVAVAKAKLPVLDLRTPIDQLITDMGNLATAAKASGDWSAFELSLDEVDKRIANLAKTDLPAAEDQLARFVQGMINAGAPSELVQGQIEKLQQIVQKMANEGLPQAAKGWQDYVNILSKVPAAVKDIQQAQEQQLATEERTLAAMKARGDAIGYILDQEAKDLQLSISIAEKKGEDANNEVLALEKIRLKQEELSLSSHGLADEYVAMINDVLKGFDQMAGVMADSIVNGKNLGQALVGEFKKIGQSILTDLIQAAMLPLKMALIEMIGGLLPGMAGGLGVVGGSLGGMNAAAGLASTGLHALAESAQSAAASISAGVGNPASGDKAGSGIAGALGNLASTLNVITGIISAGAEVASTILLSHISSDTGHIEVNTRETFAQITNIWETIKANNVFMGTRTGEILDRLNHIMDSTAQIAAAGITGGAGIPPAALGQLTDDGALTVKILANTYELTQDILTATQATARDISWVMQDADKTVDTLAFMSNQLTEIYDVLLYGKSFGQSSAAAAASQSAMQTHALNSLVTESITGNGQGRQIVDNTGATASDAAALYAPIQAQANAAADALRHAGNTEAQLAALRAEYAAYEQLSNQAHLQGDEMLAQQYQIQANNLAQQISAITHVGTTALVSAMEATDMSLVDASKGVQFATLTGDQLISTTVAQGSMLVATSVSTAVDGAAKASAAFMASMASSLVNIKGQNSSAGFLPAQQITLNSQGSVGGTTATPGGTNGLAPLPITGRMGYATGSTAFDQTTDITVHPGEVVTSAAQVAASAAQMTAQAQQIADLQAQLAGLNQGLMGSLANGNVSDSAEAQKEINAVQAKLDALTIATQENTAATTADAATTVAADTAVPMVAPDGSDVISAINDAATAAQSSVADQLAALQAPSVPVSGATVPLTGLPLSSAPMGTAGLTGGFQESSSTMLMADSQPLIDAINQGFTEVHADLTALSAAMVRAGVATAPAKWGVPMKSFDSGGTTPVDTLAMVHANENVLTPGDSSHLLEVLRNFNPGVMSAAAIIGPSPSARVPAGMQGGGNVTFTGDMIVQEAHRPARELLRDLMTEAKKLSPKFAAFSQ